MRNLGLNEAPTSTLVMVRRDCCETYLYSGERCADCPGLVDTGNSAQTTAPAAATLPPRPRLSE